MCMSSPLLVSLWVSSILGYSFITRDKDNVKTIRKLQGPVEIKLGKWERGMELNLYTWSLKY